MGVCGLGFNDFCLLTPFEFQAVLDARSKADERRSRDLWECMRVLAAVDVSPFSKGNVSPRKLMKFPWDDEGKAQIRKPVSKEEDKARFMSLMKRINRE